MTRQADVALGARADSEDRSDRRYPIASGSSGSRSVLWPSDSIGTPILSSRLRCRFANGVSSGYLTWRPPVPAPPPANRIGRFFDVNAADQQGNTAFHYAVRQNLESVIELLATHDADLHARNEDDQTPLALAETVRPNPGGYELGPRPSIAMLLRQLGAKE